MENTKTVIINGRHYDPQTGLPVSQPTPAREVVKKDRPVSPSRSNASTNVHTAGPQRSQTLNRRVAKRSSDTPPKKSVTKAIEKPAATAIHSVSTQTSKTLQRKLVNKPSPTAGRTMDVARSRHIAKFAPSPTTTQAPTEKDHAPIVHPMAARALKRQEKANQKATQKTTRKQATASATKHHAIKKALDAPSPSRELQKPRGFWARHRRLWLVIGIVIIIVVGGGYTALVNLPGLSVGFAGKQAGIKATYPTYTPDGYRLQQPVTFSDGQVTLNFAANGGGKGYTITETRSSWDSSAVLQNVVQKNAGTNYITTQDSGLTIYNYGSNAAWVNNDILYTITTQAPLSNEQIRTIATSL